APDFEADMGVHHFRYGLYTHSGNFHASNVVQIASEFNNPVLTSFSQVSIPFDTQFFKVSHQNVILDTIKPSEDPVISGDIVLRFYEAMGGRVARVTVEMPFTVRKAWICNTLEERGDEIEIEDGREGGSLLGFAVGPFSIVSMRIEIV
ncbi:hypothetical protein HK096_011292, partial [Nowakowskiella sp. JEL0078]